MYTRAQDAAGAVWPGVPVPVDTSTPTFSKAFLSMTTIAGGPAVAYVAISGDGTNRVQYARAGDVDGGDFQPAAPVVVANVQGLYNSLASVNGAPAM
jgi:hypothetical protein